MYCNQLTENNLSSSKHTCSGKFEQYAAQVISECKYDMLHCNLLPIQQLMASQVLSLPVHWITVMYHYSLSTITLLKEVCMSSTFLQLLQQWRSETFRHSRKTCSSSCDIEDNALLFPIICQSCLQFCWIYTCICHMYVKRSCINRHGMFEEVLNATQFVLNGMQSPPNWAEFISSRKCDCSSSAIESRNCKCIKNSSNMLACMHFQASQFDASWLGPATLLQNNSLTWSLYCKHM